MVWFLLYLLIQSSLCLCLCWDCVTDFRLVSSWSLVQYQLNLISFVVVAVLRSVSSVRSQDSVWFLQANEGSLWWQSHLTTHFNQTRVFLLWTVISGAETLDTRGWNVSDIRHGSSLTARRCIGVCVCVLDSFVRLEFVVHQRGSQKHAAVWWRMVCVSNLSCFVTTSTLRTADCSVFMLLSSCLYVTLLMPS